MNVDLAETTLSLCSGGAGLDLGVERALRTLGLRSQPVAYVEREAYAAQVLVARMEENRLAPAPVHTDLASFDGRPFRGLVDGFVAGWPCQPFSLAGQRAGTADPRHLWPHVARLIREIEPAWVFGENVLGHLSLGAHDVCREFQEMGYRTSAGVFSAEQVGAPHRRQRLFLLAHRDRVRELQPQGCQQDQRGRSVYGSDEVANASGFVQREPEHQVSPLAREDSRQDLGWRGSKLEYPPGPLDDWTDYLSRNPGFEPAIRRGSDGLADRMDQLHMLGNGVVPETAELAFLTLAAQ